MSLYYFYYRNVGVNVFIWGEARSTQAMGLRRPTGEWVAWVDGSHIQPFDNYGKLFKFGEEK